MNRPVHEHGAMPPKQVGPYVIQSKLGVGGMGEVYRAWDTRLERPVAVKKVLAKDAQKKKSRDRLKKEARTIASLSHPAIVRVFDLLETEDSDWIVMELIEGRTLRDLFQTRAIVETEALALAREITEGLTAAHTRGLVHRDLKSENVMVTHQGHVKILDFGLAETFEEDGPADSSKSSSSLLTTRSRVVGTSRAMSPEQAKGLALDPRSDLFSLGSLLYEMVTGEPPFQGPSTYVTMTRVCYHRQRPARELNVEISPELSNLLDHLLEKDPMSRPQSASEVSAVLDSLAGIAPLPPSLGYLLWPTESAVLDATLSDSTAGIPRFLPKSLLSSEELRNSIFIWTVLATELFNRANFLTDLGDEMASRIFIGFDRCVRDLLAEYTGFEIDKSDGFLLLFRRPIDAVRFALVFRRKLAEFSCKIEVELKTRVGIHVGEIHLRENPVEDVERGAKRFEAEGRTKIIATQIMQQAACGQILISQGVYELARLARLDMADPERGVVWKEHKRQDEVTSLFEVTFADAQESMGEIPEQDNDEVRRRWRRAVMIWGGLGLLTMVAVLMMRC